MREGFPFDVSKKVRKNILSLAPYRCARDDYDQGILLDANENSLGSVIDNNLDLHRYPSPYQIPLKQKIAAFRDIEPEQIFLGNGSDEAIDILIRVFCQPGNDQIVICPPTYGMYSVSAHVNDVSVHSVPLLPNLSLDEKGLNACDPNVDKILFLCSPNNPTGHSIDREQLLRVAQHFSGLVVVDEAYIDFSRWPSACMHLEAFPNLVILQTLSKSFGMAGARLGLAIASPETIAFMNKVKAPYNINSLTEKAALDAFDHLSTMREKASALVYERDILIWRLKNTPGVMDVMPSDANFFVVKLPDAFEFYKQNADSGLVTRYRGDQLHCENGVRVTVGTEAENNEFMKRVKSWLKNR